MKPTLLFNGCRVVCGGREMVFVNRIPAFKTGRASATNVFQCADYVGLNGPGDKGLCEMTDARVARQVKLITDTARRAA
jgi:hypothetical protein